jgi:hypothetical protein
VICDLRLAKLDNGFVPCHPRITTASHLRSAIKKAAWLFPPLAIGNVATSSFFNHQSQITNRKWAITNHKSPIANVPEPPCCLPHS